MVLKFFRSLNPAPDRSDSWAHYRYKGMQSGALYGTLDILPELENASDAVLNPPSITKRTPGVRTEADGGAFAQSSGLVGSSHLGIPWMIPRSEPSVVSSTPHLNGNWLYFGVASNHFGHFIVESLGRLWALDSCTQSELSGIVLLAVEDRPLPTPQRRLLELIAGDLPVVVINEPTRIERLIVPRQESMSGIGILATPRQVAAYRKRYASGPHGSHRIVFASRAGIRPRHGNRIWSGAIAAGEALEESMRRSGVYVLRPEKEAVDHQLACYRGAEVIILDEGSALHLVALSARHDATILVLGRRPWYALLLEAYLSVFLGTESTVRVLDVPGSAWQTARHEVWLDVDFARLQKLLASFEPTLAIPKWNQPLRDQAKKEIETAAIELGCKPTLLREV